ncbi:LuxR family transcriptional regulator [Agrobacterium tumefaciens]|uniref:helix-turn-helix transcriptional regulator n=1 Tax=Agrobacterium tumefaciens TaxID=358 RepID=UPI00287E051C|nr:LuxR family transcriptional regulator [Agrobacterium tumefaciens]MDS7598149.1 LuxR family transcriptional regulator [Agrobacterium tumefaciens]
MDDVRSEFTAFLKQYGFEYFIVSRRMAGDLTSGGYILAQNLPDGWLDVYRAKKYSLVDPVKKLIGMVHKPFHWKDALGELPRAMHRKRAASFFHDASRYGLEGGYAFPVHGRAGFIGAVFIGGQDRQLKAIDIELFDSAMRAVFWRLLDLSGQANSILNLPEMSSPELTKREMEVLTLMADGMTSTEIGRKLSISSHTVDWYINGIQRRFSAKNRQHTIALAFRRGLLS